MGRDDVLGEVDLFGGLGGEVGQGEVEAVVGGAEKANGGGFGLGTLVGEGQIAGGGLEATKEHEGARIVELANCYGEDDLGDGDLDGLEVLEGVEVDVMGRVDGNGSAKGAVGDLKLVVEVAKWTIGEGDGAAFLAGNLNVTAEGCGHLASPSGKKTVRDAGDKCNGML